MSFNGLGTFSINTSGQPVVSGTVITSTAFNALTADLATGLSTALCKDGQSTATAIIPFALGLSSAALVDISGASAGQIKFPATQNASANANTLDDYEEGTFTPTLGGSTTYTTRTATYTKIGRVVTFNLDIVVNSIGTGSATTISGLPFTSSSGTKSCTVGVFNLIATSCVWLGAYIPPSTATIEFALLPSAGTNCTPAATVFTDFTQVTVSGSYEV